MISSIKIQNFKCFREQEYDLAKLNIFCGANGVGKSSIIQSFLIIREAYQCLETPVFVKLNHLFGHDLGQVLDVFHSKSKEENISFQFTFSGEAHSINASAGSQKAENAYLTFDEFSRDYPPCFRSRQTGNFIYLSPERDGPREFQTIQSTPQNHLQIGAKGEYVAEVFQTNEREKVRQQLCFQDNGKSKKLNRLQSQLELWANEIFPGIQLRAETSRGINAVGIRIKKGGIEAEWLKPTNVGFGISYCLPILLGGLLGRENGLFIIDSPEAHLHPAAQSKIAKFLCQVANANTQVIVETHSDHVLNGVRLAVAMGKIAPSDVRIHYLDESNETMESKPILIKKDGSLSMWPAGFFDQTEKDLAAIVKHKRESR